MAGERFWRGLGELRGGPGAGEPSPEFADGADRPPTDVSRRTLLRLLGASAALAGAEGCSRGPQEYIVPYVDQPPEVTPSVPTYYATAMPIGGLGIGMLVESHEGRPTKAEGNPRHPASLGALGTVHQASVLTMYDPTRAREPMHGGMPAPWHHLVRAMTEKGPPGTELHVLLEPTSSPHVVDLVQRLRTRGRGDVVVHFDAPLSRTNVWEGAKLVFGRVLEPRPDFAKADLVLSLDDDFLAAVTSPMSWARAWADKRRVTKPGDPMSRLYVVESRLTVTGMAADCRLRAKQRQVRDIANTIINALNGLALPQGEWVGTLVRDLQAHRGTSLVVVGDGQAPEVHALGHAINEMLGNVGQTVTYAPSPIFEAGQASHGLDVLVDAIQAGRVGTLVIVGGDPAYTAPGNVDLAQAIQRVPTTVFVGSHMNRTASVCSWFCPELHFLEGWGDVLAFDGTPSIIQPLIQPLSNGKTAGQVLAALLGDPDVSSRDLVRAYWSAHAAGDFETFWQRSLVNGVVETGATPTVVPRVDQNAITRIRSTPPASLAPLEIVYYADAKVLDGRFAENPVLQELGDPVTKLTWDNAALVGPGTAKTYDLDTSDLVELRVRGRTLRAPVLVVPSMSDGVVALALGYGQSIPDRVSDGAGVNAYVLRDSRALWADDVALEKVQGSYPLALTQEHWTMEGRPIVLRHTMAEYQKDPDFAKHEDEPVRQLYFLAPDAEHQWGMTIDLNACTGCSACVVACYAENNLPAVGKSGVRLRREMDWLRIDRYFVGGDPRSAHAVVQPMLCQHCEAAPCEYVCPVNATVHSHDGLNEMIYNRCVGTRFCSNNCPYKVRRFNFFNYNRNKAETLKLAMNPDVTVRDRGVMEKCTYCVQRIREVEIRARREERPIRDLEIQTACQQTCPTGAIVFGDIADKNTAVSRSRETNRLYAVLHELGTRPRTRYLARIVNPSPEFKS